VPVRQARGRARSGGRLQPGDELPGDGRAHGRAAGLDGGDEPPGEGRQVALEDVARGAGLQACRSARAAPRRTRRSTSTSQAGWRPRAARGSAPGRPRRAVPRSRKPASSRPWRACSRAAATPSAASSCHAGWSLVCLVHQGGCRQQGAFLGRIRRASWSVRARWVRAWLAGRGVLGPCGFGRGLGALVSLDLAMPRRGAPAGYSTAHHPRDPAPDPVPDALPGRGPRPHPSRRLPMASRIPSSWPWPRCAPRPRMSTPTRSPTSRRPPAMCWMTAAAGPSPPTGPDSAPCRAFAVTGRCG
jgi:hypothetical protein